MDEGDIDLYADVDEDFNNVSRETFEDPISGSKEDPVTRSGDGLTTTGTKPGSYGPRARGFQAYIGNLTWWTTDNDITEAVAGCGLTDFIEVKFNENRINGQSKGFCCVTMGSESSVKTLIERLPKKELHGQAPVVTYATKQALMQFEAQSKTREPPPPPQQPMASMPPRLAPPRMNGPPPATRAYLPRPPATAVPFGRPPPTMLGAPPPVIHHAPPVLSTSVPPPTPMMTLGPPPGIAGLPPRAPPPVVAVPVPHVNPAFFAQGPPPGYPAPVTATVHPGVSEVEFEEIMARNRTVSSSAIARAVQDAANNEFASAIETLVTAISLIKQSKVANDDRCKILVSSLQDTLAGIENKSYSSRRERSRSRDRSYRTSRRSYSREREYRERPREYARDYRERSREREYYESARIRNSDREREYYEERQRYKERVAREREREAGGDRMRGGREPELERERVEVRNPEREKERERPRN